MPKTKKKYYAVIIGHKPGIYHKWFDKDGAEAQVKGFPKAKFKGFPSLHEAEQFMKHGIMMKSQTQKKPRRSGEITNTPKAQQKAPAVSKGTTIYTDGGCINNPGPGGYGVVVISNGHRKELSGGFRLTTNNRMELTACIEALRQLEPSSTVTLYSDSK